MSFLTVTLQPQGFNQMVLFSITETEFFRTEEEILQ